MSPVGATELRTRLSRLGTRSPLALIKALLPPRTIIPESVIFSGYEAGEK